MGVRFSQCCSEGERAGELAEAARHHPRTKQPGTKLEPPSSIELEKFRRELEKGLSIRITLGDYSRLLCDLHYSNDARSLYVSCQMQGERRVRPIPLDTLSFILHNKQELATLEAAAGVKEDDFCVALCLESEGGCLPLFFNTPDDKNLFVHFIQQEVKKESAPPPPP